MLDGDPVSIRAIWSPSGMMMCPFSGVKLSVAAMALFFESLFQFEWGVH